jgi:Protein of unknown function (DUF2934)
MNSDKQRRIEQRAYALWEAEGHPHGRHENHWHRAADQIEAEEAAGTAAKRSPKRVSRRAAENSERRSPPRRKKATDNLASVRP